MPTNPYFTQGTVDEQNIVEDLIIESLKIYGKDVLYIPRTQLSTDPIFGEDRLSKFEHAYPVEMYFDNIDQLAGQGAMIQKFGLIMDQSATLTVARKTWENIVGSQGTTHLPNRPNEGDLIYYPLTKGLFEIKFVKHQDPFYQLGRLYVYKLDVELFQYSSERMDTGVEDVDAFENLKSFDNSINPNVGDAAGIAKNNEFKEVASDQNALFDESNPFGEVWTSTDALGVSLKADSTSLTTDQTTITTDREANG